MMPLIKFKYNTMRLVNIFYELINCTEHGKVNFFYELINCTEHGKTRSTVRHGTVRHGTVRRAR